MTCAHKYLISGDNQYPIVFGCKLESGIPCSGSDDLGCPDYMELTKKDSKKAEKPTFSLSLSNKQALYLYDILENSVYLSGFSANKKMIKILKKLKAVIQ
jgi:hypothetical protein